MEGDDVVYILLLFTTIVLGEGVRRLDNAHLKQSVGTSIGIAIVLIVSGFHILHCVAVVAVNALIVTFISPKYCHGLSFGFSFLYLLFFRFTTSFGLPRVPSHTNAIQMLLTLKMVGLALEVHETAKLNKQLKQSKTGAKDNQDPKADLKEIELALEYQGVSPGFLDVFHYAFCYIGVLTGPYYKYRTYWDMLQAKDSQGSFLKHALQRLTFLPIYALLFIISSYYFPLSYATTEEFFEERSFLYRVWYMTPIFFIFRMRLYSGFILSEVACIMAGLGAYPVESQPKPGNGPTVLQNLKKDRSSTVCNFETIHNVDEYGAETCDVRGSLKNWNMTVQWWLAVNVHRRFPVKSMRTVVTMLTSAFWHGVYSGYYLSMLTVPFILIAEDAIKRKMRPLSPKLFDAVAAFMKIQWFSYMGMAFSLLAMDVTLAYWKSIYFIGHAVIPLIYLGSLLVPSAKPAKKSE